MMPATFPMHASADQARRWGCFHCCTPLTGAQLVDSGYPEGRGRYSMQCARCNLSTWFDLRRPAPARADTAGGASC
jgi:hypothetical protein